MRISLMIATLALASPLIARTPARAETQAEAGPPEADRQVTAFFDLIKAGKPDQAVGDLIASSPLWSSRTGIKEQMLAQVNASIQIYGPMLSYERTSTEHLGTMVVRQIYFAQHRDMVTRWEFDFVHTGAGWKVGYFGFTDQVQNWF